MRTGRPKATLKLNEDEKRELTSLAHRSRSAPALARRARIVLACAERHDNHAVARKLRVTPATVGKWRNRFVQDRLEGLYDEPRPGAPRTISDEQVEQVVVRTLESTPRGATHWSTREMAQATGHSHMTISRIWQAFGLQPHRSESFKLSSDPLLVPKVRDIVGLYIHPPEHAVVLCVDEKSQIEALDRTPPLLPLRPGQAERRTHDYRGTARHRCLRRSSTERQGDRRIHPRHRSIEFRKFLDRSTPTCPTDRREHRDRQLQHPQVTAHPRLVRQTPTLSRTLHAHVRFLVKSGGTLVRGTHDETDSTWRPSQRERAGARHL